MTDNYVKFLSSKDLETYFPNYGLYVSKLPWENDNLRFSKAPKQQIVSWEITKNHMFMIDALIKWIPTNKDRLVWVDSWEHNGLRLSELFFCFRNSMGESSSIEDVPGVYFSNCDFNSEFQCELYGNNLKTVSILANLIFIMLEESWNGWLLSSESTDRIFIYEQIIEFHSDDMAQIEKANEIIKYWK